MLMRLNYNINEKEKAFNVSKMKWNVINYLIHDKNNQRIHFLTAMIFKWVTLDRFFSLQLAYSEFTQIVHYLFITLINFQLN